MLRRWPILLLVILLWELVAWSAARGLLPPEDHCQESAELMVVMAGSRAYPERTRLAAELFARGAAPRILLTNDSLQGGYFHEEERNPFMVERSAWELQKHGVPPSAIEILFPKVSSTRDEAALLARYAAEHELASLLVVTSGYHVRRVQWTFARAFAGVDTRFHVCGTSPAGTWYDPRWWWVSPAGWDAVAGEYARTLAYRTLLRTD